MHPPQHVRTIALAFVYHTGGITEGLATRDSTLGTSASDITPLLLPLFSRISFVVFLQQQQKVLHSKDCYDHGRICHHMCYIVSGRESHGVRDMTRKSHTASHLRVGRGAHGAGLEKHLA